VQKCLRCEQQPAGIGKWSPHFQAIGTGSFSGRWLVGDQGCSLFLDNQRKRPGGAVDSTPAQKRSRLLPSSAGGTWQMEPRDPEESGTPAFEPDLKHSKSNLSLFHTGRPFHSSVIFDLTLMFSFPIGEEVIDLTGEEVIQLRYEDVIDLTGESSEPEVIIISDDESPMDTEQSQQQLHLSGTSDEPLAREDEEEPRDIDDWGLCAAPGGLTKSNSIFFSLPSHVHRWKVLEVHGQERRNVTLNSQEQVDGSGNGAGANDGTGANDGRGANDAPVADAAPAEQGAEEEEDTDRSDSVSSSAQQGVVITCPICMDSYSEIMQGGRHLVAALCGHVFCSECLPIALEASPMCPTCRMDLTPELYHTLYL
ncbi:hypothetical protein DV515_00002544, partial [Chloebia gouldiae]